MPLTRCPQCDGRVATVAAQCPHCSYLLAEERREKHGAEDISCHKCRANIPAELPVCCNCGVVGPRPYRPFLTTKMSVLVVITLVVVGGGWTRLEPLSRWVSNNPVAAEQFTVMQNEPIPTAPAQFATLPPDAEIRWTSTWVNVRQDRSLDSPIVLVIDPGVPVRVGNRRGSWWEAHLNGRLVGYLSNAVLTEEPETEE